MCVFLQVYQGIWPTAQVFLRDLAFRSLDIACSVNTVETCKDHDIQAFSHLTRSHLPVRGPSGARWGQSLKSTRTPPPERAASAAAAARQRLLGSQLERLGAPVAWRWRQAAVQSAHLMSERMSCSEQSNCTDHLHTVSLVSIQLAPENPPVAPVAVQVTSRNLS